MMILEFPFWLWKTGSKEIRHGNRYNLDFNPIGVADQYCPVWEKLPHHSEICRHNHSWVLLNFFVLTSILHSTFRSHSGTCELLHHMCTWRHSRPQWTNPGASPWHTYYFHSIFLWAIGIIILYGQKTSKHLLNNIWQKRQEVQIGKSFNVICCLVWKRSIIQYSHYFKYSNSCQYFSGKRYLGQLVINFITVIILHKYMTISSPKSSCISHIHCTTRKPVLVALRKLFIIKMILNQLN